MPHSSPSGKARIALDMDEVIVDVYTKFLDLYETEHGRRPAYREYAGGKIYDLVPGAEELRSALHEPGFFRDLNLYPGAREVVEELHRAAEVLIVTSAQEFRHSLVDKYDWLQENLPFLSWKQYCFVGAKHFIAADYLVDDHVKNHRTFTGTSVLYDAPHNLDCDDYVRVKNWAEVRTYFVREGIL